VNGVAIFFAFSAGMVATLNPCGFALLPTLVSYYLGTSEREFQQASLVARLGRGLLLGLLVSAGFLTVFAVAGVVAALGSHVLYAVTPWATVVIGAVLVLLGGWLLLGHSVHVPLPELFGTLQRASFGEQGQGVCCPTANQLDHQDGDR
jgi:cytochrome c-type biogenesis protein